MPAPLPSPAMLSTLKGTAAALRDAGVPFALAGGMAIWALGGPPSTHDIDLIVPEADIDQALDVLTGLGMRPERPPEGWLAKAWDDDVLVDLIWDPFGLEVTPDMIRGLPEAHVAGMRVPVLTPTDVLTSKLLALNEGHLDFEGLLAMVRGVREQIDWDALRRRTCDNPLARSFLGMVDELGLANHPPAGAEAAPVIPMRSAR